MKHLLAPLLLLALASPSATGAVKDGKDKTPPLLQNRLLTLHFTGEDERPMEFEVLVGDHEFKLTWHDPMIKIEGRVQPLEDGRIFLSYDLGIQVPQETEKGTHYRSISWSSSITLPEGRKRTALKQGPYSFSLSWETLED